MELNSNLVDGYPVWFLVQNNMPPHMTDRLIVPVLDFARKHGYNVWDGSLTTEFNPNTDIPDEVTLELAKFIIFGSIGWTKRFAFGTQRVREFSIFSRDVSYDTALFNAMRWRSSFGNHWVNNDGRQLTANAVGTQLSEGPPLHLRPLFDDKAIIGGVFNQTSWAEHMKQRNVDPYLDLWASPLKTFEAEYRCWILDGEVVEISQYRKDGQFCTQQIIDPAFFIAAQHLYGIDPFIRNVVMDIVIHDGSFKMLEFNPIHCSGWYAADTEKVLSAWVKAHHAS